MPTNDAQYVEISESVRRGQQLYTPFVLKFYDAGLAASNAFLWKCPNARLHAMFAQHLSNHHLEVGVGTAYLLDRSTFSVATPRITLMDLNENTLRFGATRLARYSPRTQRANVLEPITFQEKYDSAAMNYLLHCLPGNMETKRAALSHVKVGVREGGVVFGATILGRGVKQSAAAKTVFRLYNKTGFFSNLEDDVDGLDAALKATFSKHQVELVGTVAIFTAYV